jgi:hypothetical protein
LLKVTVDISSIADLEKLLNKAMPAIGENIANDLQAKLEAKNPRESGYMARQWRITQQGNDLVVQNDTPYASFVVDGTRPHMIHAVNSSVLAFKLNGHMIFAKSVHHPGTSPNPFVDQAIASVDIEGMVQKGMKEAGLI